MQTNVGLMAALLGAVILVGCATGTETEGPPVEERSAGGAATEALPGRTGPEGGALSDGSGASADLLAQRRIHFAFDSSTLDNENRAIVQAHAAHMVANPQLKVHLEGHCDERGTREYNLALGERRAQAVERMMRVLGVAGNRLTNVSYGEEKPLAAGHDEAAWQANRRVEISYR